MLSWSQEPLPAVEFTSQQTRRPSPYNVEVKISIDSRLVGDSPTAEKIPVKFTVKNNAMAGICMAHYGDDYTENVEILRADEVDVELNRLFPLATIGGGSTKEIAPGESFSFSVPVPISLFKMKDVKFLAGVTYYIEIGPHRVFRGEALSEPFLLPPVPAFSAPSSVTTPAGVPQPLAYHAGTTAAIAKDQRREWIWPVGIVGALALLALALKCRARPPRF